MTDKDRGKPRRKRERATAAAAALLRQLRASFLDDPDPDPEQEEMARDQVIDEPSIVYPLSEMVDGLTLTLEQRGVIAGFALDVAVNNGQDEKIVDVAMEVIVDFLLRVAAEPKVISPRGRLHAHVANGLALLDGDLDRMDVYFRSLKKTQKAICEIAAKVKDLDSE